MNREYKINIECTKRAGHIAIVSGLPGDGAEMTAAELRYLSRLLAAIACRLDKLNFDVPEAKA